jgi:hypothetical protein
MEEEYEEEGSDNQRMSNFSQMVSILFVTVVLLLLVIKILLF